MGVCNICLFCILLLFYSHDLCSPHYHTTELLLRFRVSIYFTHCHTTAIFLRFRVRIYFTHCHTTAILCPAIVALSHALRRVVRLPELSKDVSETDNLGIPGNLDHLKVNERCDVGFNPNHNSPNPNSGVGCHIASTMSAPCA